MNWEKTIFLHVGWTDSYDGTEAPEGGHAYLKTAIGVEAENFKPIDGCASDTRLYHVLADRAA
jgi:hypothetical protein